MPDAFCEIHTQLQDVVCLDKTRVVLKQDVPPLTDYIHANWVRFEKHDREFIATQGPLESTIGDFWRMCMEDDKIKCSAYWPTEAGKFFTQGKIFVNTKKVSIGPHLLSRKRPIWVVGTSNESMFMSKFVLTSTPTPPIPLLSQGPGNCSSPLPKVMFSGRLGQSDDVVPDLPGLHHQILGGSL
ncbi:Protein-tyrosine phosphatase [Ancylostoma duodenale]|uniref:Protein-tyrosine phosphatase n=1 Tax=Ancylostoma duodenale TaxID=51022 RepID=A0A0C2C9U3_9BILA|nr:Protein-tyrosine phosphatase [Ancylostoma duodenale]